MKHIASSLALLALTATAIPAGATPDFTPSKKLHGSRHRAQGMSLVIPSGWQARWTKQSGSDALVVQPRQSASGAIFAARHHLSTQQRRAPVASLLATEVRKLIGQTPIRITLKPEAIRVGGRRAGRLIIGATANNRAVELYAAAVDIEGWAFVFIGLYPTSERTKFRPAVETLLTSLRGRPPRQNLALKRRLSRCWEHYYFSSGGTGSGSSTTILCFAADGTYSYRFHMSVMGATKRSHKRGTWTVFGKQIVTTPNDGSATTTYTVSWKGSILYLNGTKYLPRR